MHAPDLRAILLGCALATGIFAPAFADDVSLAIEGLALASLAPAEPAAPPEDEPPPRDRVAAAFASFLIYPVDGQLTSGFSSRLHPILGVVRPHEGVDWSAPRGTPIVAAGNGTVIFAGWDGDYGNTVRILHDAGVVTTYAHQSAIAEGIGVGIPVLQGQVIGAVGSTGLATGPHLHFEVAINGEAVDPLGAEVQQVMLAWQQQHSGEGRVLLARFR